jgi:hypothetical protein
MPFLLFLGLFLWSVWSFERAGYIRRLLAGRLATIIFSDGTLRLINLLRLRRTLTAAAALVRHCRLLLKNNSQTELNLTKDRSLYELCVILFLRFDRRERCFECARYTDRSFVCAAMPDRFLLDGRSSIDSRLGL